MARRIAKFHKVSFEQFLEGFMDSFGPIEEEKIKEAYDGVRLPQRATAGSAGYDFYTPVSIVLHPGKTVKIPTGIVWRWKKTGCLNVIREAALDLNTACS